MGDPSISPDKPTPLMRLVLGLVTAATALFTAGPVILIVGVLLVCGFLAAAAVSLAHTGALDSDTFLVAHACGLLGLVAFFVGALGYRLARRNSKGLLGAMSRRPVIAAAVTLALLSLPIVGAAWDGGGRSALSGALVLDDLYFFSLAAVALMVTTAVLFARGLYRWAAKGRYRAGLITGAQVTVLAILLAVYRLTPSLSSPPDRPALSSWQSEVPFTGQLPSSLETERRLLIELDARLEPGNRRRPDPAAAAPPQNAEDDIRACIEQLFVEVDQVQRNVGFRYRLSDDDAHDIVRDALLNVCTAHARRGYTRLGAVLQAAAERRAINWARRRARRCEIDEEWPGCLPSPDEILRFRQEDRLLDKAVCTEDPMTQEVIRLHMQEELRFAEVGARLGLTADEARYRFNNAVRRMQKSVANACGP